MEEQTNTTPEAKKGNNTMVAIIGIVVIVVAGFFGYKFMNKSAQKEPIVAQTAQPTTASMKEQTTTTNATAGASKSAYKDGTFTAVGNYTSPGGPEELGVSLTLQNGVVKDSKVEVKATRPNSVKFQTEFADNYKSEVVGKSIDALQLSKVSGSSLAPKGFNAAVEKIKAEAKS